MIDLPLLEKVCAVVLEVAVKSTLLLLVAFAAARALQGGSAARRYLLWLITFGALLVLPVLVLVLPDQEVHFARLSWITQTEWDGGFFHRGRFSLPGQALSGEGHFRGVEQPVETVSSASLQVWFLALWALGTLGIGGYYLVQYSRIGWALCRSTPLASQDQFDDLEILKKQLAIRRPVRMVYGAYTDVPIVFGFRHAVLILPLTFLSWSWERRNIVLRHELLHIRSYDYLVQFATQLVCALYWFNPLVWKAGQRASVERECVCDDKVVNSGIDAGRYARALLAIAQGMCPLSRFSRLVPGIVRPSELKIRIRALLEIGRLPPLSSRWAMTWLLAGALVVALLASLQPSLAGTLPERFRLFYAAPEQSPALDIFIDGRVLLSEVKGHMGDTWRTDHFALPPGKHRFEVRLAADPRQVLARQWVEVERGKSYLAFVLGKPGQLSLRVVEDDLRLPEQGRQKVRIVHGAPEAGNFSIAIKTLDAQHNRTGRELYRTPELSFGQMTSYVEFESDPWFAIEQYINGRKTPITPHFLTQDGAITIIVLTHLFGSRS